MERRPCDKDEFMKSLPDDELLSAYLDNELTTPARAEVEAWLASDAEARQTLAELRGVREALAALPRMTVGEDLADSVLQLAERRMLAEPAADLAQASPPLSWSFSARRMLGRRALTWAGLAVGVALVITVANHEQSHQSGVQAPAPKLANREPPVLRPMPDDSKTGVYAAKPEALAARQEEGILLVKCFVRADAPRAVLDAQLARQRIIRDDSDRLINTAVDRLGLRAKQTPPAGLVAVGDPRYVYAEASTAQINSLLAALASRPRDFLALAIEPGRKDQEAWRAYSHVRGVPPQTPAASPDAAGRQPVLLVIQPVEAAPGK
jgi:anti-sigma factor RsiW